MAAETATTQDAALFEFSQKTLTNITEAEQPNKKRWQQISRKVNVNQKGMSGTVQHDVRIQLAMGPPNMDYPVGSKIRNIRWHAYAVERAFTDEIDRGLFRDFKRGDQNSLFTIDSRLRTLAEHFGKLEEFFSWGTGDARLGTLAAGSTTTVLNLDTVSNGTPTKAYGVAMLKPGILYDLYSEASPPVLLASDIQITETGINTSTNAVTLTAALGAAPNAGAFLVLADSYNWAPRGMAYMLAGNKTGTWYGVPMAGRPEFQTPFTDAGGQEISNALIERTLQKHGFRSGKGMNPKLKIKTSPSQISVSKAQGWNMFRFTDKRETFDTSFKNAAYEDEIFQPFPLCDPDAMYFHDESDAVQVVHTPLGIISEDGLTYRQKSGANGTGKGEYYLQYGCSDNNVIEYPNKHAVMRNLEVNGADVATIWNFQSSS